MAVVLVGVPLACWIWVGAMSLDMYGTMSGASAWMMTSTWDLRHLVALWAMWAAMMAGMMLPSAAPIIVLYARALRRRQDEPRHWVAIYAMVAGYLLVWGGFSVCATALQRVMAQRLLMTPMMEPATHIAAGSVLLLAGAYQLTPWKRACLVQCRSPITYLMTRWREGTAGAFRLGWSHGMYCLGCCWALMLVLFAGGVMNLAVILSLTVWVAIEKLAPFGLHSARLGGALLLGTGAWMILR